MRTEEPGLAKPAEAPPPEHSAPGGPVYTTGLKPRDKVFRTPCGCASDSTRHIAFCQIQHDALSAHRSTVFAARDTLPTTKEPPR